MLETKESGTQNYTHRILGHKIFDKHKDMGWDFTSSAPGNYTLIVKSVHPYQIAFCLNSSLLSWELKAENVHSNVTNEPYKQATTCELYINSFSFLKN